MSNPCNPQIGSCIAGEIATVTTCKPPVCPIPGESVAPWVKLSFEKASGGIIYNPIVTVGNKSSYPFDHYPAIKSMEYGVIDGHKVKVEICDQQGGAFEDFADELLKCIKYSADQYKMKVQWGWVSVNCARSEKVIAWDPSFGPGGGHSGFNDTKTWEASPVITFLPINMEVDFSEGIVKYAITGADLVQPIMHSRIKKVFGKDPSDPIPLKDAIKQLCQEDPNPMDVKFQKRDGSEWEFENGPDWPKARWNAEGENKMAIIQRWIEPYLTKDGKGLYATWDTGNSDPCIILWEDPSQSCKERVPCSEVNDTFIVNGGQCSPVISFNPNINWVAAFGTMGAGGATGSHSHGKAYEKTTKRKRCEAMQDPTKTGNIQYLNQAYDQIMNYEPENRLEKLSDAQNEHNKANSPREGIQPVEAELKIQGNPDHKYCDAAKIQGKFLSIAVVNPFYLWGPWNNGCGDWIAKPPLQKILTNRFWRIVGVNHNIKEGSYITTIKLKLDTPGIDIEAGTAMGGDEVVGWVPERTC